MSMDAHWLEPLGANTSDKHRAMVQFVLAFLGKFLVKFLLFTQSN
jgi:hypothetical protein